MAPLLVVIPVGPRCYFPSYVFFVLLECILADYAFRDMVSNCLIKRILLISGLGVYIAYFAIFMTINEANEENLINIREAAANGEKSAVFQELPFSSYMWRSSPYADKWVLRYRYFYGLPDDLEISVEPRPEIEDRYY